MAVRTHGLPLQLLSAPLLLAACLAIADIAAAQAPRPAPAPPAAPAPDPGLAAAQRAFDALPEADRKAIQANLIWTGDFNGAGTGGFGPMTYRSIMAFQKRAGAATDGILQPRERAALDAAATAARRAVRFSPVSDPRNGTRIGVPLGITDKSQPTKVGTRFVSPDGEVVLETAGEQGLDLAGLYDQLKADGPARKVTYKVLRPDWFVVSGEAGPRRFYTRFASGPGGLRGYTFSFPAARSRDLDRISIAIANSFEPYPTAAPAGPAPGVAGAAPGASPPQPPRPAGPVATGILVAAGKVLTVAAVEACASTTAGRQPATIARLDKAAGLALLDVPALRGTAATPRDVAVADGAALVVLGFAPGPADPQLTVASAEARVPAGARTLRVFAPLQRGAAGTAVFDRTGALLGLVGSSTVEPRQVAGVTPQASYPVVTAAQALAFLAGAGVTLSPAAPAAGHELSIGGIAASARGAVVAIDCPR